MPESGASSKKRQAAGRQNAAFGQILGLSRRGALSHRLRDRPAVRAARKNRSARQPGRCAERPKTPPRAGASHFYPRSPQVERQLFHNAHGVSPRISIHAPSKGSDIRDMIKLLSITISIHAPRKGSDVPRLDQAGQPAEFLSTLPARGATWSAYRLLLIGDISIHAPRKGSDGKIQQTSKMDFAQKSQIKISNTQNRIQFCVSSTILT